jgi:hypothetical protein
MMNEEQYLRSQMGTKNPFRVPEGYFDNFASQLMAKLPEKPCADGAGAERVPVIRHTALVMRLRPLLYAAACLLIAVMSVTVYLNRPGLDVHEQTAAVAAQDPSLSDTYFEEATDYAMIDNYDIYACLASE